MKVTIIGSFGYKPMMLKHKAELENAGHEVKMPAFDDVKLSNEMEICDYNRAAIEWADEIHVIWDARSIGTIFDFGMCFALRKHLRIIWLNSKTFVNLIKQYHYWCNESINDVQKGKEDAWQQFHNAFDILSTEEKK